MAFIDFADTTAQLQPASIKAPRIEALASSRPMLSALEHRIIDLARQDGLATLRPVKKRGWLLRLILGPTPPSAMLANEQLEALRRLAVMAWHHGYTLPVSAVKEAHRAGHSEAKIGTVIDIIGRARSPFRRIAA